MKKLANQSFNSKLSFQAVDEFSDRIREILSGLNLPHRDITRYSLTVEEILLKYMDAGESDNNITLNAGTKFFRPYVSIIIEGAQNNIFAPGEDDHSVLGDSMLRNMGLSPEYSYSGGANVYTFKLNLGNPSPFRTLIIAIAAALAAGFAGMLMPLDTRMFIIEKILDPVSDVFFNILGCVAGPMIFLAVAWGIYGIGDAATLKNVGRKIIFGYIRIIFIATAVLAAASLPFYALNYSSSAGSGSDFFSVLTMLLQIFPANIISPFVDGNTLQIIFLAIVVGIALLFLEQKTSAIAKAVEQINCLVQFLVGFVSKLVPFFIFIVLVRMIWSDSLSTFTSMAKMFILFVCMLMINAAAVITYVSVRNKISPKIIISKCLPALVIAITTASSAATFGTNITISQKKLGIEPSIASFGVPLGMVMFKPATALSYTAITLFLSEMYGVEVSFGWVAVLIITICILAVATPPIPGGGMASYVVLFLQMGIPAEAVAIALACDAILDFLATGFDQFALSMVLMDSVSKLGLVDRNKLEKI